MTSNFDSMPQRRPKTWNANWTTIHRRVGKKKREANRARLAELEEAARSGKVEAVEIPATVRTWDELEAFLSSENK